MQTENGSVKVDDLKGKTFQFANEYTNNQNINLTAGDNALAVEDNGLYWAAGKNATVGLENYSGNSVVANLSDGNFNNREGLSFYGDIKALDATGFNGNATLYGKDNTNNVITGGESNSTLWGGNGFIYGKNNGNDVIQGADEDDVVQLSGISLDDLTAINTALFSGNNDVVFTLKDGNTLTVKDAQNSGVAVDINGTKYAVTKDEDGKSVWEYV